MLTCLATWANPLAETSPARAFEAILPPREADLHSMLLRGEDSHGGDFSQIKFGFFGSDARTRFSLLLRTKSDQKNWEEKHKFLAQNI